MKDAQQNITERHSIRKYHKDQPVSEFAVRKMLEAGMSAPSSRNLRPWHFIVVDNVKEIQGESFEPTVKKVIEAAPMLIIVCVDTNIEAGLGYAVLDGAAAAENILLSANAMDLGSIWIGIYPEQHRMGDIRATFNIPIDIIPISLIVVGHPAEEKTTPHAFLDDRVHRNNW